jgi:hypothetical protein
VHNVRWHKGETCSEYDYRTNSRLKADEEDASRRVVEATTKPCPGCARPIEKNNGCDHMECEFCSFYFVRGWWRGVKAVFEMEICDGMLIWVQGAKCRVHFCWKCLLPYYASGDFARSTGGYCVCHRVREVYV